MYRTEFQPTQKGTIGITLHGNWSEPWDETDPNDVAAAERAREFEIAWFADPIYGSGPVSELDYPASMRAQLGNRLPKFTEEEKNLVRGSSEFYGMNTYTSFFVQDRYSRGLQPDLTDHSGNSRSSMRTKPASVGEPSLTRLGSGPRPGGTRNCSVGCGTATIFPYS